MVAVLRAPPPNEFYLNLGLSRFDCLAARKGTGILRAKKAVDNYLAKLWTNSSVLNGSNNFWNFIDSENDQHTTQPAGGASIGNLTTQDTVMNGCSLPSPKQKLGKKWREYQGSNNWKGLLDPLDENLRREIVKYGNFVQATYSAFDYDPQSESYASCKYATHSLLDMAGLKDSGYKVTRNIYATSSVRLPRWLTTLTSSKPRGMGIDARWMRKRTSWVGFVAVCDDKTEIARLGRRDIVVAYRGTATPFEWAENLKDLLTPAWNDCEAKVQGGFWNLYTLKGPTGRSASDQVMDELRKLTELYKDEDLSVTVTGHSLGAALALLTAYQAGTEFHNSSNQWSHDSNNNNKRSSIPVTVFSFGGPRVGNRAFGCRMEENGSKVLRIVNKHDVVTKVPGVLLNERVCSDVKVRKIAGVLEKMPWAYCHVGTELRVNSRHSPYLKPNADVACCHDLETYLHLVDGFLSSSTPFRSSAKRDLVRLLVNQKSNVLLRPAVFDRRQPTAVTEGHGTVEFNDIINKLYPKEELLSPRYVHR